VTVDTRDGFQFAKPRTLLEGEFDQGAEWLRARQLRRRPRRPAHPDGAEGTARPGPHEIHVVLDWSEELSQLARPQR
jgi:hypothetical protein